jgi:hypothetical protein
VATSVPSAQPAERSVVLVVGPGRSGTSTLAGALAHCGYAVPGAAIKGDRTNPGGFFEPRWVVDLHRSLLDRADISTLDTWPNAYLRAQRICGADVRRTVHDWLAARLEEQSQLVVKDPRIIWFRDLWVDTCADLDTRVAFATMLRHPAEVSSSRRHYYATTRTKERRTQSVHSVAGWVNVALLAEEVTRDSPRAFVRYVDMVSDWRTVLTTVSTRLDLILSPSPHVVPHPVDDFIDPALHRFRVDWDDMEVPTALRDLAEAVWRALSLLADEDGPDRQAELASLRDEYATMIGDATTLTHDETRRRVRSARRRATRQALHRKAVEAEPEGPLQPSSMARAASRTKAALGRARERWTSR